MTRVWLHLLGVGLLSAAGVRAQTPVSAPQSADPAAPAPPPSTAPPPSPAPSAESVKVVPYGVIYFNGFHNSGGSNNQDIPLWALAGTGDTGATARQSRFGLKVSVPAVMGAKIQAILEADFFGG